LYITATAAAAAATKTERHEVKPWESPDAMDVFAFGAMAKTTQRCLCGSKENLRDFEGDTE